MYQAIQSIFRPLQRGWRGVFLPALLGAALILAAAGARAQAPLVIAVPGDYPTLQAAIDAAHDGDKIVYDGLYHGDINFRGKKIILVMSSLKAQTFVRLRPADGQSPVADPNSKISTTYSVDYTTQPTVTAPLLGMPMHPSAWEADTELPDNYFRTPTYSQTYGLVGGVPYGLAYNYGYPPAYDFPAPYYAYADPVDDGPVWNYSYPYGAFSYSTGPDNGGGRRGSQRNNNRRPNFGMLDGGFSGNTFSMRGPTGGLHLGAGGPIGGFGGGAGVFRGGFNRSN